MPKAKKAAAAKRKFDLNRYPTYDPKVEGFGDSYEWRQTFYARMGFEEASRILSGDDKSPRQVLGVGMDAPWTEIRSSYRKLSMQYHPDRILVTGFSQEFAEEQFKRISAAYTILAREFGE